MTDYEPGTVAVATVRGVPNVRVFRYSALAWATAEPVSHLSLHPDQYVTDVRPLVVLDPKGNPEGLDEFRAGWFRSYAQRLRDGESGPTSAQMLDFIADQIEAQTKPPKPAEPTGTFAQVRDSAGLRWVRLPHGSWVSEEGTQVGGFALVDAVEVLA